jgi:MauM/NapG family ferredoxin protein
MEKTGSVSRYSFWYWARLLVQLCSLLLFFFLFIKTDYSGSDTIEYAVNILFRIDPLLAFCTMLAARTFIALMVPALVLVVLSLFFGRFFCGWLCPMGGLLDFWRFAWRIKTTRKETKYPRVPRILLLFLLVCALFGLPFVGYFDPFSILVRGLVQAVYPAIRFISDSFFSYTYHNLPDAVNLVTEPVYAFMQATILPFEQRYYELTLVSGLILAAVFFSEFFQSRFFCRNVCPLGALLGLFGRYGAMSLRGGDDSCGKCTLCRTGCRMGAVDENRKIQSSTCILCMDCMLKCPKQIIHPQLLGLGIHAAQSTEVSISRRQFLACLSAGVALPPLLAVRNHGGNGQGTLIRPPGALIEKEFLSSCVRCGECIQVCITNGLQPAFFQAGLEGAFTPYLLARSGYCEFNCTLCGQVCPTGALRPLKLDQKHTTKIGHAWFDKNICLPFAKNIPCIVCEEHCPTPDKAIKFNLVEVITQKGERITLKQPYVVDELCIGCGICETKCPLPGRAAIFVTNTGEDRDPENRLPGAETAGFDGYS